MNLPPPLFTNLAGLLEKNAEDVKTGARDAATRRFVAAKSELEKRSSVE
jgi:hypothetical protein